MNQSDPADPRIDVRIVVFSAQQYVREFLETKLTHAFTDVFFVEPRLSIESVHLASKGYDVACLFVNDDANEQILEALAGYGVKTIAMRCAGYDRVDLVAAKRLGMRVVRVPTYSPRSVAEMALAMAMTSARCLLTAIRKVQVGNYSLDGLVGMELSRKTYGVIGTGNIGVELIKLLRGFEGRVLAYDVRPNQEAIEAGATYVELDTLLGESDIVSLHVPLLPSTRHLMNKERLMMMKDNAMLVNVSRGGLIDTDALLEVLLTGHLGAVALDVYEHEDGIFFNDFTRLPAKERMKSWDHKIKLLDMLPQVLVTPHCAFLTHEALANIADTTVANIIDVFNGKEHVQNEVQMH